MFIQTEETPNPQTLKFNPGVEVLKSGTMNFNKGDDISNSPLAQTIFKNENVDGVFLAQSFISITKAANGDWEVLKPIMIALIMDHFVAGHPVVNESNQNAEAEEQASDNDNEVVKEIKELIETRVRPAVAQDGGDIIFKNFDEGIVYLELHGACSGCPSSTITLKSGIENMLKHYIPEVKSVEAV